MIVISKNDLLRLCNLAESYNFDRKLRHERSSVDPDVVFYGKVSAPTLVDVRVFVLRPVMLHEHIAGRRVPADRVHVRCEVLMGTEEIEIDHGHSVGMVSGFSGIGFLDVLLHDWEKLNAVSEAADGLIGQTTRKSGPRVSVHTPTVLKGTNNG